MNKNRTTLWVLITLTVFLITLSVIVVLTEDKPTINTNPIDIPILVFNDNIEFELNLSTEIEPLEYLYFVIDPNKSTYDRVEEFELQLNVPGEHSGSVVVYLGNIRAERSFKYFVADDVRPIIHISKYMYTRVGNPLDLNDYIIITDNSGEEIEPVITGDVNWDVPGIYTIRITATDASGNEAGWTDVVEVGGIVMSQPNTNGDSSNTGGGTSSGGSSNTGGGTSNPTPEPDSEPTPEPEPDPVEDDET